jgi:hypothetical protein
MPEDVTVPCPCTDNPWRQFSEKWHIENPEEPHCHRSGYLTTLGGIGGFTLATIQALIIPRFGMSGLGWRQTESGMWDRWEWLGITQDERKFNRILAPFGMRFVIQNVMPYYVGGDGTQLIANFYGLMPLNFEVPTP